jgi:SAM-dependent methyltransferase
MTMATDPSCALEDGWFDALLDTYARLGYSRDLVTHWALPRRDALTLLQEVKQARPLNVLEVGTFVGVTTLLLAHYAPAGASVHTVDPNFPLQVELGAMHTRADGADLSVRQQELALRAAREWRLDGKITFHAGGFSTGSTFASAKTDPRATAAAIGPEVCQQHGPFDFIFIDGLHYTSAVLGDLRLAAQHLQPGGRIVLHDLIGMWGSNVRRAVFQFLAENHAFVLRHGRYADIYDGIGVIQQSTGATREVRPDGRAMPSLLDQPEFVANLAAVVFNLCPPRSVICLGRDRGKLLPQLMSLGVEETLHVGSEQDNVDTAFKPFTFRKAYDPQRRFDLCIYLADQEPMSETQRRHVVASAVRCSDTILFGATPPGEIGVAAAGTPPLAWWVREFWQHRYRLHDVIRPAFEPLRCGYATSPIYPITSSELCNLYLVRRETAVSSKRDLAALLEHVLIEKESRIEDLSLQAVFTDILLQDAVRWRTGAQELYDRALAEQTRIQGELGRTEAERTRIQGELERAQRELSGVEAERTRTQEELSRVEGERTRTQGELGCTEAERTRIQGELERTRTELSGVEAERSRLQGELQRTQAELTRANAELLKNREWTSQLERRGWLALVLRLARVPKSPQE